MGLFTTVHIVLICIYIISLLWITYGRKFMYMALSNYGISSNYQVVMGMSAWDASVEFFEFFTNDLKYKHLFIFACVIPVIIFLPPIALVMVIGIIVIAVAISIIDSMTILRQVFGKFEFWDKNI